MRMALFPLTAAVRYKFIVVLLFSAAASQGRADSDNNIVLCAPEVVPQSYLVDGVQTGYLIDIVTEAFRRARRPLAIRLLPWARCVTQTRMGSIDGFFAASVTSDRLAYLSFSHEALMTQTYSLFVRDGAPISFDGDLAKMAHFRIGVVYQVSYGPRLDEFLRNLPDTIEEHGSLKDLIKMLAGGRIDLLPGDRETVIRTAAALGLENQLVELKPSVDSVDGYLAFTRTREMTPVIEDFDRALKSIKQEGKYSEIIAKYQQE